MGDTDDADYYELLQVHPAADARIIKNAYRTLLAEMRIHPDLGGSGERTRRINAAYEVLSDPDRRARYDRRRAAARDAETGPASLPSPHAAASASRLRIWGWAAVGAGLACAAVEALPTESLFLRLTAPKTADARPAADGFFEAQTSTDSPRQTRGGAGVLTDAEGNSWGVTAHPSAGLSSAKAPAASASAPARAESLLAALVAAPTPDQAAQRRRDANKMLIGSGVLAAVLLWW